MSTPEEVIAEMKERFGENDADGYLALMRAMRSLVFVWEQYFMSPTGSFQEFLTGQQAQRASEELKKHPDHAAEMVEGLISLIVHMRRGGTYEAYFESVGISPTPEEEK